jgi:hypothetical protein
VEHRHWKERTMYVVCIHSKMLTSPVFPSSLYCWNTVLQVDRYVCIDLLLEYCAEG